MVVLSKAFRDPLCYFHCSQYLYHPGKSCFEFLKYNIIQNAKSTGLYFIPIVLMPLIFQARKLNKNKLKEALKYYVQCVVCCTVAVSSTFNNICVLRKLTKRFYINGAAYYPSLLSGLQIGWLMPDKVLKTVNLTMAQCCLEFCLRTSTNGLIKALANSKFLQMIIFMLNSAIVLHAKQNKQYNGFWFVEPLTKQVKVSSMENKSVSDSDFKKEKVKRFIATWFEGLQNYILIGLALDLYSLFNLKLNIKGTNNLWRKITILMKAFQPKMSAFFFSYLTLYKFTSFIMEKYLIQRFSKSLRHQLSAAIGGLSFIFVNKMSFLNYSIIASLQVAWEKLCNYKSGDELKSYKLSEFLKSVPMKAVLFPFIYASFSHNMVFHFDKGSSLARTIGNVMTSYTVKNVVDFVQSHSKEQLIEIANSYTTKGYFK